MKPRRTVCHSPVRGLVVLLAAALLVSAQLPEARSASRTPQSKPPVPGILHNKQARLLTPNHVQQQQPDNPATQGFVVDTAVVRSSIDTTRHTYSFDAHGRMSLDQTQTFAQGGWTNTLLITRSSDDSGYVTMELDQDWQLGEAGKTSFEKTMALTFTVNQVPIVLKNG